MSRQLYPWQVGLAVVLLMGAHATPSGAATNLVSGTFSTVVTGNDVYGMEIVNVGGGVRGLQFKTYHYPDSSANPVSQDIEGFTFAYDPSITSTDDYTDSDGNLCRVSVWGSVSDRPSRTLEVGTYTLTNHFSGELTNTLDGMISDVDFPIPSGSIPAEVLPYLAAGPYTQSTDESVVALAESILFYVRPDSIVVTTQKEHAAVTRIIDWCIDNLTYTANPPGPDQLPEDAVWILQDPTHRADCSGFSHVAIALARAQSIPARIVIGVRYGTPYSIPGPGGGGYPITPTHGTHAWLEVYYPDEEWIPYDAVPTRFYHYVDTRNYRFAIGVDQGNPSDDSWRAGQVLVRYTPPIGQWQLIREYNSSPSDSPALSYVDTYPTPSKLAHGDWPSGLGVDNAQWVDDPVGTLALFSPNPSNADTEVLCVLPRQMEIRVAVYDVGGREVRCLLDGRQPAGRYVLHWDGRDVTGRRVAGGVYFCCLQGENSKDVRKVVLVR